MGIGPQRPNQVRLGGGPPHPGFRLQIGDLLASAAATLARLHALGVALPPSNRLARARSQVEGLLREADTHGPLNVDAAWFGELLRTMLEHHLIVRCIDASDPREVELVGAILSGGDTPAEDRRTHARDTQLELVVATMLRLAGVVGVHLGEPDLRIPAGSETLGIAVKRISSRKQLSKRLKKAVRQIRSQDQRGLVVVGLDALGRVR